MILLTSSWMHSFDKIITLDNWLRSDRFSFQSHWRSRIMWPFSRVNGKLSALNLPQFLFLDLKDLGLNLSDFGVDNWLLLSDPLDHSRNHHQVLMLSWRCLVIPPQALRLIRVYLLLWIVNILELTSIFFYLDFLLKVHLFTYDIVI